MSYVSNLVHCVWATKRRFPFITLSNRDDIMNHIRKYAGESGFYIDFINAHKDHIHCLLSLNPNQDLSSVIKGLKGESSQWIRTNIPNCSGFRWAVDYYAVSVSPRIVNKVREYIRHQDNHHSHKSWQDEQREFFRTIDNYSRQFRWDRIHD